MDGCVIEYRYRMCIVMIVIRHMSAGCTASPTVRLRLCSCVRQCECWRVGVPDCTGNVSHIRQLVRLFRRFQAFIAPSTLDACTRPPPCEPVIHTSSTVSQPLHLSPWRMLLRLHRSLSRCRHRQVGSSRSSR